MLSRLRRLKGDGGWFGVVSLLLVPAALVGIPVGITCIYIAVKI